MPTRKSRKEPAVGTICSRNYKGKTYTMKVIKTEMGIGYKVGRDVFKTPSAAAKAITKTEVNGWVFWGLDAK